MNTNFYSHILQKSFECLKKRNITLKNYKSIILSILDSSSAKVSSVHRYV